MKRLTLEELKGYYVRIEEEELFEAFVEQCKLNDVSLEHYGLLKQDKDTHSYGKVRVGYGDHRETLHNSGFRGVSSLKPFTQEVLESLKQQTSNKKEDIAMTNKTKAPKKIAPSTVKLELTYANGQAYTIPRIKGQVIVTPTKIYGDYNYHGDLPPFVSNQDALRFNIPLDELSKIVVKGLDSNKTSTILFEEGKVVQVKHEVKGGDTKATELVKFV